MRTALRIGLASALVSLSAAVPWLVRHQARLALRANRDALEQRVNRLSLLRQDNERLSNLVARATSPPLKAEQLRELLRLRNERRWLGEQTNEVAQLTPGTSAQGQRSLGELQTALAAEITEAMKRILPALQPALQSYALAHSNQPPSDLSDLADYFPLVGGRKMAGLQIIKFARGQAPRPDEALLLRGDVPRQAADDNVVRVYGFSDGRVVEVSSEDGNFGGWEAQHLDSPLAGTEDKVFLESDGTVGERALFTKLGASVGISGEDAARFFDRAKQEQKVLGAKLAQMQQSLTGSPEEKQRQIQAAVEQDLSKLAIETLGDKGPALVQKLFEHK